MKHCIFILLCCMAIACHTSNDHPVPTPPPAATDSGKTVPPATVAPLRTDSAITLIRKAFQQINAMPLKSQHFKWTAESCNDDGTATYYLDKNNRIVKVVETGAIGDGGWTTGVRNLA